ncbi:MAG: endonuclease/exonuclease/phosphatase family protein [Candidatus Dependentiae bacterium]|nr:endonuclease/exonuclease/phosphatase family protein [Candidatus Dependentiae bacterium]
MKILLIPYIRLFKVLAMCLLSCGFIAAADTYAGKKKSVKSTFMALLPEYSDSVLKIKDKHKQKKAKQSEFKALVELLHKKYSKKQLSLPEKTHKDIIRVATYNVHCWRGPEKELGDRIGGSFAAIFEVIKNINADVLVLQEVELRSPQTLAVLATLGYRYCVFAGASDTASKYGNMIVSKVPLLTQPIKKNFSYGGHHSRSFIKVEIDLSKYHKKNLVFYGSHFDDLDGKARLLEAQELVDSAHTYDFGKNVVIGADFNEQTGKAIKHLASQGFINSFDLAGIAQPTFTHWSGKALDGLYINRCNWNLWIDGSYVLYSGASDHLPVIMDIDPTK